MSACIPIVSLSLLATTLLAAPISTDSQDTSSESFSPFSSSYTLFLPEQRDVLRLGAFVFDSEVVLSSNGGSVPILNLVAKRRSTEEEKATALERGEEVSEYTLVTCYTFSRAAIRTICESLVPEESMLEWASDAELPSSSVLSGDIHIRRVGATRFSRFAPVYCRRPGPQLSYKVVLENGEAKRTVLFAGRVLTDQEVKEFVAYLKAAGEELEAIARQF